MNFGRNSKSSCKPSPTLSKCTSNPKLFPFHGTHGVPGLKVRGERHRPNHKIRRDRVQKISDNLCPFCLPTPGARLTRVFQTFVSVFLILVSLPFLSFLYVEPLPVSKGYSRMERFPQRLCRVCRRIDHVHEPVRCLICVRDNHRAVWCVTSRAPFKDVASRCPIRDILEHAHRSSHRPIGLDLDQYRAGIFRVAAVCPRESQRSGGCFAMVSRDD